VEKTRIRCIFSVDVEDWFHILEPYTAPDLSQWSSQLSLVERNFNRLLDIFDEAGARVTCFFLGWVAEKFPHLVRDAHQRGHEIASHGYSHRLCYELGADAFLADILRARKVTEDALGGAIHGYRAPGFSVTDKTPWFFDRLAYAGFTYDSSVFPATRQHGGLAGAECAPYLVETPHGQIVEFPISIVKPIGFAMCFFGGGYLRLSPYSLLRRMGHRVLAEGRPLIFYIHPREIDPSHPRMPMGFRRHFKSYVGLRGTQSKIQKLLRDFPVSTFEHYLSQRNETVLD
jgi:polysaccharide deacetylase family protein (PEP-CTERM system associated)